MNVRRMSSIGAAAVAVLALAGCGGTADGGEQPAAASSASAAATTTTTTAAPAPTAPGTTTATGTTTTTPPAPAPDSAPTTLADVQYERNESYYFTSPDGGFRCGIVKLPSRTEAGCEGATDPVPPRPENCMVNWGNGIRVQDAGPAEFMCSGGSVYTSGGDDPVLPSGSRLSKLGYTCETTDADVTCANDATGHGFTIAAGSNTTF
ncbi:hypothetical protein ACWDT5_18615 [Rhodococcus aetherivorans]|uniref:Lipoprotein n=3 Tax=Rhodococcus TaxID=1827 RepID=A0ABQ0YLE5_9NOCA|nr:hypothetical protein [Rhodococcus aetherivorans]MBC2588971.1 hypothetical protein [Rhodococcus aetherivorans]MDV6293493.1 hypothetical protein [Rhodococcus aetherivorans]NGP29858.1 hypothetical protein [Rhodococcus aetherivorans]UGQ42520.1 hypothetical protein LRQ66_04150 [Rhodococcus aetherivorans]CCW14654.1 FIG01001783: hypothetical protein [Rhodococcus aetherivorans]